MYSEVSSISWWNSFLPGWRSLLLWCSWWLIPLPWISRATKFGAGCVLSFPWLWTWLMLWLLARKLLPSKLETRDTRLTREQLLPGFFFFKIIIINLFYMNKMIRIREVFFYGQNIKWNGKTKKSRKYLLY